MIFYFTERDSMDEEQRYANGMAVRRAVLGDQHVDRAQANMNDFNAEFQNLIGRIQKLKQKIQKLKQRHLIIVVFFAYPL